MSSTATATKSFFSAIEKSISEVELDALPYGVIQLDSEGIIMRYNAYESGLSGLNKQKVLGKNFFKQVAPCTDVRQFYGRFRDGIAAGELHTTFRFHFAFPKRPCDVTIKLFYNNRDRTVWLLVQPFEGDS